MSEPERETEEDEGGDVSETAPILPPRPTDCPASARIRPGWLGLSTGGLRTLQLPCRALAEFLFYMLLPGIVFLLMLLPAATVVYLGFLCHSRVHPAPGPRCRALLSDRSSAALIVLGFLSLPPLLALAAAARARLLRRLRALLPPPGSAPGARRPRGSSEDCRLPDQEEQLCARV